jgi:hypothetical protein
MTLALTTLGCSSPSSEGDLLAFVVADPWYSAPPDDVSFSLDESTEVDSLWEVSVSSLGYAESLLERESVVRVDDDEELVSLNFGVKGISVPAGRTIYLARAVYLWPETGGFSAYFEDGSLLVRHDCLGRHPAPMKRTALLLALPEAPRRTFIVCRMAE